MKRLAPFLITAALLWTAALPLRADDPPALTLTLATDGTWDTAWQGVEGFTYFMQWSPDLVHWLSVPMIAADAGPQNCGGPANVTPKFFVRLRSIDRPTLDVEKDDFDGDGLTNLVEVTTYFTDPLNTDTDGDGMPDDYEAAHHLNPNDPADAAQDPDGDGLTNLAEKGCGTDPTKRDTDGDGVSDSDELMANATNPQLAQDLDADGMADDLEKHLAKQFLAVNPAPEYWGTRYQDLQNGDLDPGYDYTGDGQSIGELAVGIAAIAGVTQTEESIPADLLFRRNSISATHGAIGSPDAVVSGTYQYQNSDGQDGTWDITAPAELTAAYLASQLEALSFGSASADALTFIHGWSNVISYSSFHTTPEEDHQSSCLGGGTQTRFRLRAPRADHGGVTYHFIKITTRRAYGAAPAQTDIVSTEAVVIELPPGHLTSTWHELKVVVEDEMLSEVQLIPVEIVVPQPSPGGGFVTSGYVPAGELTAAKMQDSLTVLKSGGVITREDLDINKDADRFYIRYRDGAILALLGDASATISTQECADATYNDDPTEVDLIQNGNDLISKPMILVSDHTDDDYAGNFVNVADDQKNDPTHIVQLGGKVRVGTVKIGGHSNTVNLDLPVKKKRKVTVDVIILNDGTVDIADMTATVERDLKAANERYAQVGVEIVKGSLDVKPLPTGLDLPDGELRVEIPTSGARKLSDDIKRIIDTHGTNNNLDDIHVFYVPMNLMKDANANTDGVGLNKIYESENPGYQYNVFIEKMTYPYGLAHELGHILTDARHPMVTDFVDKNQELLEKLKVNLMCDGVVFEQRLRDTKRLWDIQEKDIPSSGHAIPVQP